MSSKLFLLRRFRELVTTTKSYFFPLLSEDLVKYLLFLSSSYLLLVGDKFYNGDDWECKIRGYQLLMYS